MQSLIQEELFSAEQYTRTCSMCRGNYPRTAEFFTQGNCKDRLASYCRQCAHLRKQKNEETPLQTEKLSENPLHKLCAECGKIFPMRHFYMSSLTLDGKTPTCKFCTDANTRARQSRQQRLGDIAWCVYFIKDIQNGRVIIGSSRDPYLTLIAFQEITDAPLHLLAIHEMGEKVKAEETEYMLHRLFKTYHAGNGWFEFVSSLEKYIALIQKNEYQKAELLLQPLQELEEDAGPRIEVKQSKGPIIVEGQHFPNLISASVATGIQPEQIETQRKALKSTKEASKVYK